jgi:peptidoglycan/LPS O-acetylase OafA/YrhL
VSVFFVISGFLLYRPFAFANLSGAQRPALKKFWARRLKRIIPAYWVAFLVVTYVLHGDTIRHGWGSLAIYLGFAQIYFSSHALSGITQAWSLCTEMTFYLTLPLWAALMARRSRGTRSQLKTELVGLAALTAASVVFRVIVLSAPRKSYAATITPNWLPAYTDLFALGMLLAVLSSWFAIEGRRPTLLWHPAAPWVSWSLAALALFAVSNIGLPLTPVTSSPLGLSLERQTLYGLFAFWVVLPAVFGIQDRGLIRLALRWRPLALVGVVSYGIYLWHEAWIELFLRWTHDRMLTIPLPDLLIPVTALAVASATLSYVLVERPVRLLGRGTVRLPLPARAQGRTSAREASMAGARP